MLVYLITSRSKGDLLKLFLPNPDQVFYIRDIAGLTDEPVNAVRRELDYLWKAGLWITKPVGEVLLEEMACFFNNVLRY